MTTAKAVEPLPRIPNDYSGWGQPFSATSAFILWALASCCRIASRSAALMFTSSLDLEGERFDSFVTPLQCGESKLSVELDVLGRRNSVLVPEPLTFLATGTH